MISVDCDLGLESLDYQFLSVMGCFINQVNEFFCPLHLKKIGVLKFACYDSAYQNCLDTVVSLSCYI